MSSYPGSPWSRPEANRIERPSGDQSTSWPCPTPERSTSPEPSTSMMYITPLPVRLELKAIRFPFGDHDGYSPPSVFGTRRCPEPSAFTIPIQLGGPGYAYRIFEPSGDQAGKPPLASRCLPDPSAFMTQSCG